MPGQRKMHASLAGTGRASSLLTARERETRNDEKLQKKKRLKRQKDKTIQLSNRADNSKIWQRSAENLYMTHIQYKATIPYISQVNISLSNTNLTTINLIFLRG